MTYQTLETGATSGAPIELYEFIGTYTNYHYTSSDQDVVRLGQTYRASSLVRSEITTGTQVDDNVDLQIDLPFDEQICMDYAYSVSPPQLFLKVWRYHRGQNPNMDAILYWSGEVTNFITTDHVTTIQVPTFFSYGLAGNLPSICYQTLCNHVLYDGQCKVSKAANQTTSTIQSLVGVLLVVRDSLTFPDNYLRGGVCFDESHEERRMIVASSGSSLTLSYPFSKQVVAGDVVALTAGCNHSWAGDCATKFNNQKNFGGFPFIPLLNPFTGKF